MIKIDYKIMQIEEEPLPINIFTPRVDKSMSTIGVKGHYVFSQILIDCLLRLKSTKKDTEELIQNWRNTYEASDFELNNIDKFENDNLPGKALRWYTRLSFFHKTLNEALRKQDIHMIFLFRGFIYDIQHQLKCDQVNNLVKVYRGQTISNEELKILQQSCGQLVSVTSFFSTSKNKDQALQFIPISDEKEKLERVLFEIDADPKMATTKPFADISQFSEFPNESEILFMLGSIFRLNSVNRSSDNLYWTIQIVLCGDEEHGLKQVLTFMKRQVGKKEINLRILAKFLSNMGKFDLAKQYFNRLLNELPSDDPSRYVLYKDLAELASQVGDYDDWIHWGKQLLLLEPSKSIEQPKDLLQIPNKDLQLYEQIGRGGFGTVYRARWLSQYQIVAVKILHLTELNKQAEKEFFNELSLMHSVRYVYIVTLYGVCMETGKYGMVMEYMSLGSLYKILHQDRLLLNWLDRLSIASQAAKGVNFLHKFRPPILHRDIKSMNFLLERFDKGFVVKVCDFGLAQTRSETTRQTQKTHLLLCTFQWTAPEVLDVEGEYTEKSDVYSLGMVYWELAENKIPYDERRNEVISDI
ncbi:unnamed protein product, partial [Rotaria sp. Silwood1]